MTVASPISMFGIPAAEVGRFVGSLGQVARIDSFTEVEGTARGTRRLRLVTGGGLEVDVHPDRALDLGHATFRGVPVAWMSPTGMAAPQFYDASGTEWLRTFGGGLLATCGLDAFGPPSVDEGVDYPMHGRIGAIAATLTQVSVENDVLTIAGVVRQTKVFGENLVLHRVITADVGGSSLRISDTVTNEGLAETGHMVLYHVNVGWPLIDERATLDVPSHEVVPRDDAAESGAARWHQIEKPQAGFAEQVYRHDFGDHGTAVVSVDNPAIDIRFELSFDTSTLPGLHQWKMSGEGHYVLGLEPTNVNVSFGRASARETGALPVLARGESVNYALEFSFSSSAQTDTQGA